MKKLILFLCTVWAGMGPAFAQGQSALPFLLISPAAVSNGMGETSVALYRDDPLAFLTNPAHLGMFSRSHVFSGGYASSDWLPGLRQPDLSLKTFGFNGGVNFRDLFGFEPEISIGVGYSRVRLNLGTFAETSPDGPEVISTFDAYETADHYSAGIGFHSWIHLAAGYTIKQVHSALAPFNVQGQDRKGETDISMHDFGFVAVVPVMEIAGRIRNAPVTLLDDFLPILNLSMGLSKNNMSDGMVVYTDPANPDPLPRYARAGVGCEVGFDYGADDVVWRPVSFSWTREANDLLVNRYPAPVNDQGAVIGDPPPPDYRGGFGDIRFVDNLILGKSNADAIVKTGWQLELGEILSLRGGRVHETPGRGDNNYSTSGYTIRMAGIVKILQVARVPLGPDNLFRSILTHLDIRYTHSEIDMDIPAQPKDGTEFSSLTVVLTPW